MISVCCCSINSKYETQIFIDALYRHNQDVEFEVCLAHDDRVNDNAGEYFETLQKKYPTLKVVTSTKADAIRYMQAQINYYKEKNLFSPPFRQYLQERIQKYQEEKLFDPRRAFLWLPSGWLYNQAVKVSTGDTLVISPADYLYLFSLKRLRNHLLNTAKQGLSYWKLNGLRRVISNSSTEKNKVFIERFKDKDMISPETQTNSQRLRDYNCYPSSLEDCYIPDPPFNRLLNLADENFITKSKIMCEQATDRALQVHGLHCMTRKAFDHIGGFSEEFYGRAYSDDKMTNMGLEICRVHGLQWQLPAEFTFAWSPRSVITSSIKDMSHPANSGVVYLDTDYQRTCTQDSIFPHIFDPKIGRVHPNNIFDNQKNTIRLYKNE